MKQPGRVFEIKRIPEMFAPLEEWKAFATKIRARADEIHEAEYWLQRAQQEIDRLSAFEAGIDMSSTKALIFERLRFLEGLGFVPKVLADERKRFELLYSNDKARRSVWINAFYPLPEVAASYIKVSNLDDGSFWFSDWMAHKGRPFDEDARFELDMTGTVEHDTRRFDAEANGDMKEVLAGRAWEDVPRAQD